jgi:hypothetical protein
MTCAPEDPIGPRKTAFWLILIFGMAAVGLTMAAIYFIHGGPFL